MSAVRLRFAPSPTGFLHVGGARTAIFNWLYTRRHGGTFVLRIEDTDARRSSAEMVEQILDGLNWLGLAPDEGPFYQSQTREQHVRDALTLLDAGHAYRCFCSPAALDAARREAPKGGRDYMYARTCRALPPQDSARRAADGEPFAVRFAVPEGEVSWDDLVHARMAFAAEIIEDFILLRSDGSPTYMMSVVSDDIAMDISHVVRGDDHLSNTPKQILLYRAFARPVPAFAHLPLILGEDKKRLSKRHGAVSVLDYRDRGYLPQAMFNFLALLGWSPGGDVEKLDVDELVRAFDFAGVGKAGAVFDLRKLDWLNGSYIAGSDDETLAAELQPLLEAAGVWREALATGERAYLLTSIGLLKGRARTLAELAQRLAPYLVDTDALDYDPKAAKKHLKGADLHEHLAQLREAFATESRWEPEPLERVLRDVAERRDIGAGRLIHATRLAVTGQGVSPGIFDVLVALGRVRSLRRLTRLIDYLQRRPSS